LAVLLIRGGLITFACLLLETSAVRADTGSAARPSRPNIVFFFTDDHAPHAIGAYDGWLKEVNPTPHIDQLAREGMLFRNSFCTNSICGPSRAVIITGKHSHKNGFMNNGNRFDGSQQTFPKLMQKAGYETAMFGKWHLKSEPQGFDAWQVLIGQGQYYNPDLKSPEGKQRIDGHCTDVVTDLAIEWLHKQRSADKPFVLMCQHKAPHRCWMPAERHLNLYDDIEIPEPATLFDRWEDNASPARWQEMEIDRQLHLNFDLFHGLSVDFDGQQAKGVDGSAYRNMKRMNAAQLAAWKDAYGPKDEALRKANLSGKELVRWKYQRYAKNYLRCVKGVDENLKKLQGTLDELGLSDNTVFVYSSDQGFYIGDHGWYDKRWMYEESLKMPLIIKWPGVTKPGSVNESFVQNLDYAETFLEMAGAPVPEDMQGRSLVPLLKDKRPDDWRKSIYYHYYEFPSVHMVPKHNGIRTERYKLINFYEFGEFEFYDLDNDPDELTNEYNNPKYADQVAELKAQLEELRVQCEDETVTPAKPAEWQQKFRQDRFVVEESM
jgi:arylsulfatase A-like enzyme